MLLKCFLSGKKGWWKGIVCCVVHKRNRERYRSGWMRCKRRRHRHFQRDKERHNWIALNAWKWSENYLDYRYCHYCNCNDLTPRHFAIPLHFANHNPFEIFNNSSRERTFAIICRMAFVNASLTIERTESLESFALKQLNIRSRNGRKEYTFHLFAIRWKL